MARWKPESDKPVGPNEHVGRRLFAEPMLVGAQSQRPFAGLDLRNFEEKRDLEFSLDRLGRSSVENAVVNYLRPRAVTAGKKLNPPRPFNGWAVLQARKLENPPVGSLKFPVKPSPIAGTDLSENIFHAHAVLPESFDSYSIALQLRELFEAHGLMKPAGVMQQQSWIWRLVPAQIRRLFGRD